MNKILEIGLVREKKIREGINFFGRKFVEQLASKKLALFPNCVIIATKFADFFGDIYDAFSFEIKKLLGVRFIPTGMVENRE